MYKLKDLARDMEIEAKRRGFSVRELSRGLRLELNWLAGYKRLKLSRPLVPPSMEEEITCRRVFNIPNTARTEHGDYSVGLRWEA